MSTHQRIIGHRLGSHNLVGESTGGGIELDGAVCHLLDRLRLLLRQRREAKRPRVLAAVALVCEPDLSEENEVSFASVEERGRTYELLMLPTTKEEVEAVLSAGEAAVGGGDTADAAGSFSGVVHRVERVLEELEEGEGENGRGGGENEEGGGLMEWRVGVQNASAFLRLSACEWEGRVFQEGERRVTRGAMSSEGVT